VETGQIVARRSGYRHAGAELAETRGSAPLGESPWSLTLELRMLVSRPSGFRKEVVMVSRNPHLELLLRSSAIDAASAVKVSCVATSAEIDELSILDVPHSPNVAN
jgi:hypothetical protein